MSEIERGIPRILLTVLAVLLACGEPASRSAGDGTTGDRTTGEAVARVGRPDVLLVTLDTARADHFSYTGDSPVETPHVDRLAAEGAGFLSAISPVPITLPAHASLLTGLLPPSHGVRNNGTYRLGAGEETLAEILADDGYATAAFVAAAVVDRRYGLDQGFDLYDDEVGATGSSGLFQYPRRAGAAVVARALEWLDGQPAGRPTLVWVHLFDAHAPYEAPEPERSRYPESPYAAAIAYADRMVGVLLDGYRQRRRYDGSVMVVAADHGESLGEHGEATHGIFVYDATIRVPLVIRAPGVPPGLRIRRQVRLVDVVPTVLGLLGKTPAAPLDGTDLRLLFRGPEADFVTSPAWIESRLPREQYGWSDLAGLRTERWKLVVGAGDELYDLRADPEEREDLAGKQPERVRDLRRQLRGLAAPRREPDRIEADAAVKAQLGALGYLSAAAPPDEVPRDELADPRERLRSRQRMLVAIERFTLGDRDGAVATYREIVAEEPRNLTALAQLGDLLSITGHFDEALGQYERALDLAPSHADLHYSRGHCLERLGRLPEAVEAFARALAADPRPRAARDRRWNLLRELGRAAEVEEEARGAIAADPDDATAYLELALADKETAGPTAAEETLERGLARTGRRPALVAALGEIRVAQGRIDEGLTLYREALEREPTHSRAAGGLAHVLLARNEVAAARQVLERAASSDLSDPKLLFLLAEARARQGEVAAALELAERSAAALPGHARAWSTLGAVRMMAGELPGAAEAFRRSLALDPDDRTTALNLAQVYEQLGDPERARQLRAQ